MLTAYQRRETKMILRHSIAAVLALAVIAGTSAPVRAGLLEPHLQPPLKTFPHCNDPKVLHEIIERFNWAEEHTFQRGVKLEGLDYPRERVVDLGRQIPRRYCRADGFLSNGRHRTVLYLIEGGQGFSGTGFNVEFCVNGYDRWRVYNGSCRTLNY